MKLNQVFLFSLLLSAIATTNQMQAGLWEDFAGSNKPHSTLPDYKPPHSAYNPPQPAKPTVHNHYTLTNELNLTQLSNADIARMTKAVLGSLSNADISRIGSALIKGISYTDAQRLGHALIEGLNDKDAERLGKAFAQGVGQCFAENNIMESATDKFKTDVAPYLKSLFQSFVGSFINFENAIRFGTPLAFGIAIPLAGLYGSRVLWKVIEKRITDPRLQILLPGSKYGYLDRVKRNREGYKTPATVFDQSVKDRLVEVQEKTKNIKKHIRSGKKITYDNLLLYGKPGTGKTLFAQVLADITDMDLLSVTAASLLQSGVEGIKYFNELVEIANNSKYGAIIFIDEAEDLFIDRTTLSPESDHYKVLNHILALTGSGSSKFMLVVATNHAYLLDEAMGRRFQDRVLMSLPNKQTREELIDLYLGSVLFNTSNNSKQFASTARELCTVEIINHMIEQSEGLSHAEIKDMISAMHKKAVATSDGIITEKHILDAIKQAVEKALRAQEDKKKRELQKK